MVSRKERAQSNDSRCGSIQYEYLLQSSPLLLLQAGWLVLFAVLITVLQIRHVTRLVPVTCLDF